MDLKKAVNNAISEMGENKIAGRAKSQKFEDKKGDNYNETVYLQRLNLWKLNQHIKILFTDNSLMKKPPIILFLPSLKSGGAQQQCLFMVNGLSDLYKFILIYFTNSK